MINLIRLNSFDAWDELVKKNEGKNVFYMSSTGGAITLSKVIKYNYPIHGVYHLWHITNTFGKTPAWLEKEFYISHDRVTRNEFITHLSERYPEYMEWFLFNKEWLD
jgi:hypothetical protein